MTSATDINEAATTIAAIITGRLNGQKMTFENLPFNVAKSMETAQHMSHFNGHQKKEVVTKAICMAIDSSDVAGPFEGIVLEIVPMMCDTIIDVDKGAIVINKKLRNKIVSLMTCCT